MGRVVRGEGCEEGTGRWEVMMVVGSGKWNVMVRVGGEG